jgi:2-oxoisovalerate ferredoxin oxidoreductase alpha subunit
MRQLCKGNVAVIKGAVLAGCRAYYGYPITPASEVAEAAALYLPEVGGTFIQAESETASINMVYGAASAGVRVMTASSGPGLSLMQEGISYLAGAELPCVIVDVMRGGPGLGNIAPEQSDYFAMVKGGGHGNYRNLVLAPASVQEMADLTVLAFELADKYRNPAIVLTDGFVGQMSRSTCNTATSLLPRNPGRSRERPRLARTWSAQSISSQMIWKPTSAAWRRNISGRNRAKPGVKNTAPTTPN